jgi:hypothetical protein
MKPAIGTGQQDPPFTTGPHMIAYLLNEIDRTGDIGVHHLAHVGEILIEKTLAKTTAGIRHQEIDGPTVGLDALDQSIDALKSRKVSLDGLDRDTESFQSGRRLHDAGFVSGDDEIVTIPCGA